VLQARFEVDPDAEDHSKMEKPNFPVLVRWQCMYAQLGDVEVEIREDPRHTRGIPRRGENEVG
jgi:hypothetical protein